MSANMTEMREWAHSRRPKHVCILVEGQREIGGGGWTTERLLLESAPCDFVLFWHKILLSLLYTEVINFIKIIIRDVWWVWVNAWTTSKEGGISMGIWGCLLARFISVALWDRLGFSLILAAAFAPVVKLCGVLPHRISSMRIEVARWRLYVASAIRRVVWWWRWYISEFRNYNEQKFSVMNKGCFIYVTNCSLSMCWAEWLILWHKLLIKITASSLWRILLETFRLKVFAMR